MMPTARKPSLHSKRIAPKRITLVLHSALTDRVFEKAATLQQNPNNFVNLCVEGMLEAMDTKRSFDPDILGLYNRAKGRPLVSVSVGSISIVSLCGFMVVCGFYSSFTS
jgi:hypothetical protein